MPFIANVCGAEGDIPFGMKSSSHTHRVFYLSRCMERKISLYFEFIIALLSLSLTGVGGNFRIDAPRICLFSSLSYFSAFQCAFSSSGSGNYVANLTNHSRRIY